MKLNKAAQERIEHYRKLLTDNGYTPCFDISSVTLNPNLKNDENREAKIIEDLISLQEAIKNNDPSIKLYYSTKGK
ncbi:MAG: hypothetical protein WC979_00700 [Candidatus Pacearchaeota archaeon]|jgi:hypothetical protein|nr:hypothetical protein [Clostridia bacterium]